MFLKTSLILFSFLRISGCAEAVTLEEVTKAFDKTKRECLEAKYPSLSTKSIEDYCNVSTDSWLGCWPPTQRNASAVIKCSPLFFKDDYIERKCKSDGSWEKVTYKECKFLTEVEHSRRRKEYLLEMEVTTLKKLETFEKKKETEYVFQAYRVTLYALDAFVCFVSLLLVALISIKEKRFVLHMFLILSFLLRDSMFVGLLGSSVMHDFEKVTMCNVLYVISQYSLLVQLSLMFCEGYYQFHRFFHVFKRDINVYKYIAVSWVLPAILTFGIYTPLMSINPPNANSSICWIYHNSYIYNYIIYGPMLLILSVNLFFATYLLRLIISKLKKDSSHKFVKAKKATRGLLVLLFLLGGGYLVTIYGPDTIFYKFFQKTIQSTQGTVVCISQILSSKQLKNAIQRKIRPHLVRLTFLHDDTQSKRIDSHRRFETRTSTFTTIQLKSEFYESVLNENVVKGKCNVGFVNNIGDNVILNECIEEKENKDEVMDTNNGDDDAANVFEEVENIREKTTKQGVLNSREDVNSKSQSFNNHSFEKDNEDAFYIECNRTSSFSE